MSSNLRILCLHGFTSNATVHAHQLRRLTALLPDYDFLFPDGPHKPQISTQFDMSRPSNQLWSDLVLSLSPTTGHRAWWYAREFNPQTREPGTFVGLEESLTYLSKYLCENAAGEGVDAIWGFSQGGCLAGILCALLQESQASHSLRKLLPLGMKAPKAGVIFSGFRARFEEFDGVYENGIQVPVLHVLGEQDPLVSSERSEALLRVCERGEVMRFEGGHEIPKGEGEMGAVLEFMRRNCGTVEGERVQSLM